MRSPFVGAGSLGLQGSELSDIIRKSREMAATREHHRNRGSPFVYGSRPRASGGGTSRERRVERLTPCISTILAEAFVAWGSLGVSDGGHRVKERPRFPVYE